MEIDPILWSRVQFGFTLSFHILFPTLTIGLGGFLSAFEALWLRTGDDAYLRLYRFWLKIFALGFGMGVVSGVVLSFEFGTNFAPFSRAAGNVIGPLTGYEVLTAFFLEASFLPIALFGWGRVSARLHFFSTLMVALGSILSAFWILSANSWMHTPAGFVLQDGVFAVSNWWHAIFNPSFPYRLAHMLTAAFLTGSFVIAGISAWHLLMRRHEALARCALSIALWAALFLAPLQILLGDLHGQQVQRDQPMKVAAMEALWHTTRAAPFVVFALPDTVQERNRFAVEIPYGASLILKHDPNGKVLGLNEVPRSDRPYVPIVFFAFRLMVGIGFLLLAVAVTGFVLRRRAKLFDRRWFLWLCVACTPLGFVAVVAGWAVTETGRQPWIVQGLLRTAQGASALAPASITTSVMLFLIVYHVLLLAFLYFGYRVVERGPEPELPRALRKMPRTAWRASDEEKP